MKVLKEFMKLQERNFFSILASISIDNIPKIFLKGIEILYYRTTQYK